MTTHPDTPLDHFARQVYRAHLMHLSELIKGDEDACARFIVVLDSLFDNHAGAIKREEMERLPAGTREALEAAVTCLREQHP